MSKQEKDTSKTAPYSAKTKDELLAWANKGYPAVKDYFYEMDGKKVFVIIADPPTNSEQEFIYIFDVGTSGYGLLLVQYTYTARITIEKDEKNKWLLFRSEEGKKLLIFPFDGVAPSDGLPIGETKTKQNKEKPKDNPPQPKSESKPQPSFH
jgi:hypothetical protein